MMSTMRYVKIVTVLSHDLRTNFMSLLRESCTNGRLDRTQIKYSTYLTYSSVYLKESLVSGMYECL